jgi:hypothetical protein
VDNTKVYLKDIEGIEIAQCRVLWYVFPNRVINLQVPLKVVNFVISLLFSQCLCTNFWLICGDNTQKEFNSAFLNDQNACYGHNMGGITAKYLQGNWHDRFSAVNCHAKVRFCGGKRGYFCKCRSGTKFICTVTSDGVILPSSCNGQLWTADGAMMIRQKN